MFSTGHLDRLRRSIAVRLSLWLATLFAVGFTAIFALLYVLLGRQLEARDADALLARLNQYAAIYETWGLRPLQQRVAEDATSPQVRSLLIGVFVRPGEFVPFNIPPDWIERDAQRVVVADGWGGFLERRIPPVVRVPLDQQKDFVHVGRPLSDGLTLVVGRASENRQELLEPLRRTFFWVGGAVVIVGFTVGALAARRATRPLQNVVETARRIIETGSLEARVPVPSRKDDVAELVHHFNTVLDKNAGLLKAMREALDNVAHDLRTPLTSLRGTAELALSQPGNEIATREALADCVERADEVLRLLRALMEISEAEAGMLKLAKERCDLGQLARGAVELYADVAEARHISLTIETPNPAPIEADATRMRQAIANLIDNAIKYSPEGGKVHLRTSATGTDAVLEVRDSGPGVPAEEQPRIWERLYRGDQSRSQSGLGLGLSLVRAIVEAHGGKASVRNAPDQGAIFEIRLPLAMISLIKPVSTGA